MTSCNKTCSVYTTNSNTTCLGVSPVEMDEWEVPIVLWNHGTICPEKPLGGELLFSCPSLGLNGIFKKKRPKWILTLWVLE